MRSSSDVSAQLMTALLSPALQVLTVMNNFPRRRRSARVNKKLPRMLAAMVERPRDNNSSTTGVGYGKRVRQDPPTSEYQQKAQTSTPHQKRLPRIPIVKQDEKKKQLDLLDATHKRACATRTGNLLPRSQRQGVWCPPTVRQDVRRETGLNKSLEVHVLNGYTRGE